MYFISMNKSTPYSLYGIVLFSARIEVGPQLLIFWTCCKCFPFLSKPFQPPWDIALFLFASSTTLAWRWSDFNSTSISFPEPFFLLVFTTLAWTILCVVLIYYVLRYSMMLFLSLIIQRFLLIPGSLKSPHLYFLV